MNLFSSLTRLGTTTALAALFVAAPLTLTLDASGQVQIISNAAFADDTPPEGGPGGPGGSGGFPGGEPGGPGGEPGGTGGETGGTGGAGGTGGEPGGGTGHGGGTTPPEVTPTPVSQPAAPAPEREAPGQQASAPAATPAATPTPTVSAEVQSAIDFAAGFQCPSKCTARTVLADGTITIDMVGRQGIGTFRVVIKDRFFEARTIESNGSQRVETSGSFPSAAMARQIAQGDANKHLRNW